MRFFEPNKEMIKWLQSYIGNRIPIDVGCGAGDLLVELNKGGIGIEPLFDEENRFDLLEKRVHVVPIPVQECASIIKGLGNRGIMIFARPCHSDFVEQGIHIAPSGMEILYITKPKNVKDYCDLGRYDKMKKLVKHKGRGEDKEIVYSILK